MQHELRIIDLSGDTKLIWDSDNEAEVENAKKTFKRLKKEGYMAFSVKMGGDKGRALTEFDPDAEKMIMAPPVRGG